MVGTAAAAAAPDGDFAAAAAAAAAKRRKRKKEEGKRLKREKIAAGGGERPRRRRRSSSDGDDGGPDQSSAADSGGDGKSRKNAAPPDRQHGSDKKKKGSYGGHNQHGTNGGSQHGGFNGRFGRVMDAVPCPGRPNFSTLSVALPGSVASSCQTQELRTHLVGQIARACSVYRVDEIVVYDDKLGSSANSRRSGNGGYNKNSSNRQQHNRHKEDGGGASQQQQKQQQGEHRDGGEQQVGNRYQDRGSLFAARLLQYCECPQYLRRQLFPHHPDLRFAGLLPPVDAPHHVRADDRSKYREGVVLEGKGPSKEGNSLVNCGIYKRPVEIDRRLTPGIRCTVEIDPATYASPGRRARGKAVPPSAPRHDDGTYWGYTVRIADSLQDVFDGCPYGGGGGGGGGNYDLTIGTSERGHANLDDPRYALPPAKKKKKKGQGRQDKRQRGGRRTYRHALVVFGGVAGIEECVDADESVRLPGSLSHSLFDQWVNICPYQGSRTIRTEEAVLIALAKLSPHLSAGALSEPESSASDDSSSDDDYDEEEDEEESGDDRKPAGKAAASKSSKGEEQAAEPEDVEFSDDEPSEESSEEEDEDDSE